MVGVSPQPVMEGQGKQRKVRRQAALMEVLLTMMAMMMVVIPPISLMYLKTNGTGTRKERKRARISSLTLSLILRLHVACHVLPMVLLGVVASFAAVIILSRIVLYLVKVEIQFVLGVVAIILPSIAPNFGGQAMEVAVMPLKATATTTTPNTLTTH